MKRRNFALSADGHNVKEGMIWMMKKSCAC